MALDGTPLIVPTGGIRRYVEELSRALAEHFPADVFELISDQLRRPAHWLDRRWWLWGAQREMKRRRSDLFHGTDFSVPYLPLRPSVMTLHDLSPWRSAASDRVRRRTPHLIRFGAATMLLTPSEAVRREAMAHFNIDGSRIVSVPLAAPDWMRPVPRDPHRQPYLLCVATIEPRKNIALLIDAWREVRKTFPIDLVLAGRVRDGSLPPPVEPGLRFLGSVNDRELPALYSGAVACLYPSLYEGFGLPVLEAMQCGAMVINSTDPAVRETGAHATLALDASDPRAWVDAMTAALNNPALVEDHRQLSLARARLFTWARTAQGTYEVYLAAIKRFRHG